MQINKTTHYAMHIILKMAEEGRAMTSKELSDALCLGREYTLKVLRMLRKAGLLCGTKGINGGYLLQRSLESITVLEIMQITEYSMDISSRFEEEEVKYSSRPQVKRYFDYMQQVLHWICTATLKEIMDGNIDLASSFPGSLI